MNMAREIEARQTYETLSAALPALDPEEAINWLGGFIREFPDYPRANNDLAVLLHQKGDSLQALARFEKAARLDPRNSTFRKNLAGFYFTELGWTDDAIFIYTELLKEDPADIETLEALALISVGIDRPAEAGHFLRRILELEPWNTEAWNTLDSLAAASASAAPVKTVVAPSSSEDVDSLLAELRQLDSLDTPFVSAAPEKIAAAPPAQENVDSLLAELRQSVAELSQPLDQPAPAADPDDNAALIAALEKRLADDPLNTLIHNDLGVLHLRRGSLDRSLDHHELAVRYAPGNLTFIKNLAGVCVMREGRMDQAIGLLSAALKNHPDDTELLAALTQVSVRLGRKEEALLFLGKILELEPLNEDARFLMREIREADSGAFFLNA